jgi:DUF4097 and DUF4098 domain-containing protein YvlB
MKRFPTFGFALATLVAATPAHAGEPVTWREQSEWIRDAHGVAVITVDDARGEVNVQASPDDRIHLRALKVTRGPSLDDAKRIAGETTVELDETEGRLVIRVRYPHLHVRVNLWSDMSGNVGPNDEVRLALEIPAALTVEVASASGDVTTLGLRGSQRLRTASGDVTVSDALGPVTVSSASGDVTGTGLTAVRINTASGDVTLENPRGAVDLDTSSGDIVVRGAADSVRAHSVSGSVRLDGAPRGADLVSTSGEVTVGRVAGRVRARTVSGDLEARLGRGLTAADLGTQSGALGVTLDSGFGCRVEAETSSGDIDLDRAAVISQRSHGHANATLAGGGPAVGLRTVSGDIRVVVGGGK